MAMTTKCPRCNNGVRCPTHAAAYAVQAMADRGMVPLPLVELGRGIRPSPPDGARMRDLATALKIDVMFWAYAGDDEKGLINGWYVPQVYAFVLATMIGKVPWDYILNVMRVVKEDPGFREAYEAAWRVDGHVGVNAVLDHYTPGVTMPV